MKLNDYYICDDAGYVKQKIKARTLVNEVQSNGNHNWVLKNLYGVGLILTQSLKTK